MTHAHRDHSAGWHVDPRRRWSGHSRGVELGKCSLGAARSSKRRALPSVSDSTGRHVLARPRRRRAGDCARTHQDVPGRETVTISNSPRTRTHQHAAPSVRSNEEKRRLVTRKRLRERGGRLPRRSSTPRRPRAAFSHSATVGGRLPRQRQEARAPYPETSTGGRSSKPGSAVKRPARRWMRASRSPAP